MLKNDVMRENGNGEVKVMSFQGTLLRQRRKNRGLTQVNLAHQLGSNQNTISRLENDRTRQPHLKTLRALSQSLSCDLSDFFKKGERYADN